MIRIISAVIILSAAVPALSQDIVEPRSKQTFTAKYGAESLLGVGLRTKTIARVKVYAVGLYVADAALAGPLKGKAGTPEFYQQLMNGDFRKTVVMKFLRDVSAKQVQDAFRESLKGPGAGAEAWLRYMCDTRSGQEYVIAWNPGVGLETKVSGIDKPAINDKVLASAIFAIWLGPKPIQDDMKKVLVARASLLMK